MHARCQYRERNHPGILHRSTESIAEYAQISPMCDPRMYLAVSSATGISSATRHDTTRSLRALAVIETEFRLMLRIAPFAL
jgi:hypothetical protein